MKIGIIHHENNAKDKIREVLHHKTDHDVIWGTNYGLHALELCENQRPDLILLDVYVMEYDGIQFISELVTEVKCPVLLVTDSLEKSSYWVFEAMSHGAIDVAVYNGEESAPLIQKVQQMALLVSPKPIAASPKIRGPSPQNRSRHNPLILFGASTGGPLALASILSSFPQDLNASVVIVQHVDEKFSSGLSDWLSDRTLLPVELVREETRPVPGKIYLSDSKWHLVMTSSQTLSYSSKSDSNVYRPSVDVLFESVAQNWKIPSTAVLLTGMGADGAVGLKKLKDKGWITIAEAESSCVVFGMPKAAIEMKAATEVLDLHQIPLAVLSHLRRIHQKVAS